MLSLQSLPETQTALALSVFLLTFAYEDGATLLAATLVAAGRLDTRLGLASAFLGVWIGDLGLYLLGSHVGRKAAASRWSRGLFSSDSLRKAENWFARRGPLALIMSRFLPGSRLPLYIAAGALRLPARRFSTITGVCAAVWVAAIFVTWRFAPKFSGTRPSWVWTAGLLLLPLVISRGVAPLGRQLLKLWRKYRRWEFWPAWAFYPPVAAMCAWLGVRYRGFSLPTAANPAFRNGGIVGESKIEVLQALMKAVPEAVADAYLIPAGELSDRRRAVEKLLRTHGIGYPFVLKPNVGQRGAGFKVVHSAEGAEIYLRQVQADVILQRYVAGPKEAGIFYYRLPGQCRGDIFSVTKKVFPMITGDGERTLEELLRDDERASLIAQTYLHRFGELQQWVPPAGESIRLVEAGNHCQGCIFRDGGHLISEPLRARMDEISRSIPGFFIGRYDVRYDSDDDLQRGENFQIIELNGAASEATNIYDEGNSLLTAYRTLYRQWELVYAIGRANRDAGHSTASVLEVWRDWKIYRSLSAAYPAAD